jgi:hypothetical protein
LGAKEFHGCRAAGWIESNDPTFCSVEIHGYSRPLLLPDMQIDELVDSQDRERQRSVKPMGLIFKSHLGY